MIGFVAIIAILFSIIITLYIEKQSDSRLFQDSSRNAEMMMEKTETEIMIQLSEYENKLNFLSEMYSDFSRDTIYSRRLLAEVLMKNPAIVSAFVYFEDYSYNMLASISDSVMQETLLTDEIGANSLKEMMDQNRDEVFWNIPEWSDVSQQAKVTVWKPIMNQQTQLGFVGFNIFLDTSFIQINTLNFDNSTLFVLSESGVLLTDLPNFSQQGGTELYEVIKEKEDLSLITIAKLIMNGESCIMQSIQLPDHQSYYLTFIPVPKLHISLCMLQSKEVLFSRNKSMHNVVRLLLVLEILVLLLTVFLLLRKRIRFLRELSVSIDYVGKGVFNAMIPDITTHDEFLQLHDDFHQMQNRLALLYSNTISNTKLEEQQEQIKQLEALFKKLFLPQSNRKFVFGNAGFCEISIKYHSTKFSSNDFYDYFFLNEHQFICILGNVSGNSSSKTLFLAYMIKALREGLKEKCSLARFAENFNNQLVALNDEKRTIKLLIAVFDSESRTMNFVNIGYELLYLIRDQIIINIESIHGIAIGMIVDAQYTSSTLELNDGDLLCFSDMKVPNLLNKSGINYSKERFEQMLSIHKSVTPQDLLNSISEDIDKHIIGNERANDYSLFSLKLFEKQDQK